MTLITNDCLAWFMYDKMGDRYASPFIGSLFESDEQYLRFCQNYDYYMSLEPTYGEPKLPYTIMGHKLAPTMFLGDIEIHWPHETRLTQEFKDKFQRRKERAHERVFIWSDMTMYNKHDLKLIKEFKKISDSLFITKEELGWGDKSLEDRPKQPFSVPTWLDYDKLAAYAITRIKCL